MRHMYRSLVISLRLQSLIISSSFSAIYRKTTVTLNSEEHFSLFFLLVTFQLEFTVRLKLFDGVLVHL